MDPHLYGVVLDVGAAVLGVERGVARKAELADELGHLLRARG